MTLVLITNLLQEGTGRPAATMCRINSSSLSLREVEEARKMRLKLAVAGRADYEEQAASAGCEGAAVSETKEGDLCSYWDVAMVNEWEVRSGDRPEDECCEEDSFEDVVLHLADDFEEEVLRDLYAREDEILSSLPSATSSADKCVRCETFDGVPGEHPYNVRQQDGTNSLSPCATLEENQTGYAEAIGTSDTVTGAALPNVFAGSTYMAASASPWKTTSKHIVGPISRSVSVPLNLVGELDAPASLARWRKSRGGGTAKGGPLHALTKKDSITKSGDAPAAIPVRSVALLRRSCSSPLPPLHLAGEQFPPGISAAAEKRSPSHLYCPKPQQQAHKTHLHQKLHINPNACVISEADNDRRRCNSEVAAPVVHHGTLTQNLCSTQQERQGRVQKGMRLAGLPAVPVASWGSWADRSNKSSSSCRRRGQKKAEREELGSWAKKLRDFRRGSWCCSSKCASFGNPGCRAMAFAFLLMLLSLSAEVVLLRLAGGNIMAESAMQREAGPVTHSPGESAERSQPSQAVPSVADDNIGKAVPVIFNRQATTTAAASKAEIARTLWRVSNIVYVALLLCSLLRFLVLMSPGFAPTACVRLMTCVSAAFLTRGLWIWCFALEASAWHLRLEDWTIPAASQRTSANAFFYSVLDACGIWAFAPDLKVGSPFHGMRHASIAAGTLYGQSLIMSILVWFWGIYTSKQRIISYLVVPAVATLIWALRISASYLSAAAATTTLDDATTFDVLFYFPASEATPCLLILCFVVVYHLAIEAAVQKHLHRVFSGSKSDSTQFRLCALFDRCFPCALLQDIVTSIENLPARLDAALCQPVVEPACSKSASPALPGTEQKRTGHGSQARPCCDATGQHVLPASSHISVCAALPFLPPPTLLALPCLSSSVHPLPFPTTRGFAGSSRAACEVARRTELWSRHSRDTFSLQHDRQYVRHYSSPSWKSKIFRSACCTGSSNKFCSERKDVCSGRSSSACTTGIALSTILDWDLREAEAVPQHVFHSCIADVGNPVYNGGSPPRRHQSRECHRSVLGTDSEAVREDRIGGLMHFKNWNTLLQRITLVYAGSGDFDFHLLISLFQRCMWVFHMKARCEEEEEGSCN